MMLLDNITSVRQRHFGEKDEISRLIVLFADSIKSDTSASSAYRVQMSIKVLQLLYLMWMDVDGNSEGENYAELRELLSKPGVFTPKFATDSYLWAHFIQERKLAEDKHVLEMGAGTGIVSIYLSLYANPRRMVATDVSEFAVVNLQENVERFGIPTERLTVLQGNLFESVPTSAAFDIILWAMPWLCIEDPAMLAVIDQVRDPRMKSLLGSVADPGFRTLSRFISEARSFLKPGGQVLLISTDFIDNERILQIGARAGYSTSMRQFAKDVDVVKQVGMILNLYQIEMRLADPTKE